MEQLEQIVILTVVFVLVFGVLYLSKSRWGSPNRSSLKGDDSLVEVPKRILFKELSIYEGYAKIPAIMLGDTQSYEFFCLRHKLVLTPPVETILCRIADGEIRVTKAGVESSVTTRGRRLGTIQHFTLVDDLIGEEYLFEVETYKFTTKCTTHSFFTPQERRWIGWCIVKRDLEIEWEEGQSARDEAAKEAFLREEKELQERAALAKKYEGALYGDNA